MRRLIVIAALVCVSALPADRCRMDLPEYWNKFAVAATAYVSKLSGGVKDLKLRTKMEHAWTDLEGCGCF